MKKILIPLGALLVSGLAYAQIQPQPSSTENYIQSRTYLEPVTASSSTAKQVETVQYFDGLGRPKQIVNVKASPQGKDVVSHIEYDGFGRQVKDYLPVPQEGTQNGAIYTSPLTNAVKPELYGPEKIYAEKVFENSPLDRIMQQKQVGTAWDNKPVSFGYDANIVQDAVKKYTTTTTWVDGATRSVLSQSTNYGTAQLYKNTLTDEDGNVTIEFKNGEGQVLLVRKVLSATENADTYYVYNEYNQLAFVIPPKASVVADPGTVLNDLCYQYRYDGRNRLVEKKLPGKGWEYMIYDKADRLVMSQDANLKEQGKWLFTKHDKFSRVLYTGIVVDAGARNVIQGHLEAVFGVNHETEGSFQHGGITIYYGKTAAPTVFEKILTVNYYDTYPPYDFNPPFPGTVLGQDILADTPGTDGLSTKGLSVMSLVKNIEDDNWTKNYTWYDKKGRGVSTYSINHLGGRTWTQSKLDFAGVVQQTITRHKRLDTDTDKIITENFTYDHQNRLLTHTHQVDNNPVEYLAQNTYNELSQLRSKKVGGISPSTPLQQVDYLYNIRGWMTKINDPKNLGGKLFGYEIKYNSVEGEQTPDPFDSALKVLPRYNGNIAEVDWRTSTVSGDHLRRYGYVYDKLNRLSAGFYQKDSNPSAREYYEKVSYDLNGNIMTLKRSAEAQGTSAFNIDELTYVYENSNKSNRLLSVTDSSTDYRGYPETSGNAISYDNNGNMISHNDKGLISIDYNFLNLPSYITYRQGLSTRQGIIRNNTSYLYRSDGVKVKKIYRFAPYNPLGTATELSTEQTDYLDSFQYKTSLFKSGGPQGGSGNMKTTLEFYPTTEGYFDFVKNKYIYNYADHLGNVRLSYFHNGSSIEVLEENNYYPFGLKHEGYNPTAGNPAYQYKYNGKELQAESGMYDYGARFYMPDIGRWGVVDPLAEKMRRHSPYNYAYNNPIMFIDPDGREGILYGEQARNAFRALQNSISPSREYPDDYKGKLGRGDWKTSDRLNNTNAWQDANKYNLQQENGSSEYNTITERTAFYLWFQNESESRGYETKWAGAAFIVANQMAGTENSLINWTMSSEIKQFAQDGNKAIFDNVFPKLKGLYNGPDLKGAAAKNWDISTLTVEQRDIVGPIYDRQSSETLSTLSKMAKGQGIYQLGVPQYLKFKATDDIRNWKHRFNHGMNVSVPAWEKYKSPIVIPQIYRFP